MLAFVFRRLGTMVLTMLCLTLVVFFLVNLEPNLKKLAISQTEMRTTPNSSRAGWSSNGYRQNFFVRYGQWIGVVPKQPNHRSGDRQGGAALPVLQRSGRSRPIRGILEGDFGCSTKFKTKVAVKLFPALGATGILMFWVMVDDGADRAADRHPGRHARRLANRSNAVGRLDRHDRDA